VSPWTARRFWTSAIAVPCEGGYSVQLDTRPLRTPLKALLVVPTLGLAQEIAAEWQAQETTVRPDTMPFTRTANSAIDKVAPQVDSVAGMLAAYGESDHLCYRAEGPQDLIDRQAAGWDPLLRWSAETLGAPLMVTSGIMPVPQPPASLAALRGALDALDPFRLAACHDLVALSGSLVLGLAVTRRRLDAETAWNLSRIDEDWQIALWGRDEDAAEVAERKHAAFLHADRFYGLCG